MAPGKKAPLTPGPGRGVVAPGQARRAAQADADLGDGEAAGEDEVERPGGWDGADDDEGPEEDFGSVAPAPPKRPVPLRKSLEAYFSNEGLKSDRYLLELILESPDGWVDMEVVLGLKQVRALRAKRSDVLRELRDSWLETSSDPDGSSAAIRRPPNRGPLPKLGGAAPAAAAAAAAAAAEEAGGTVAADVTRGPWRWPAEERMRNAMEGAFGSEGEPPSKRMRPTPGAQASSTPSRPAPRAAKGQPAAGAGSGGVSDSRRLTGEVKTFNMRLGLGKIACKETRRDVVVRVADLAGFDVGDEVSFILAADPELGTPSASKLRALDADDDDEEDEDEEAAEGGADGADGEEEPEEEAHDGAAEEEAMENEEVEEEVAQAPPPRPARPQRPPQRPPARGPPAAPPAAAAPAAPGRPAGASGKGAGRPVARPPMAPGQRLSGTIKGLNKKLGVGGITCAETGSIVKVPATDLAGFETGDYVTFLLGRKGEATEVEAA